jgi:putative transposase
VRQQARVLGLCVELGQIAAKVRAHVPRDRLLAVQVRSGEDPVPTLTADLIWVCRMKTRCVAIRNILYLDIKRKYDRHMRLRYNYRLYPSPGQRAALARAFGCARVVYNDALRARQQAHAAGLPYLTDPQPAGVRSRGVLAQPTASRSSPACRQSAALSRVAGNVVVTRSPP